MTYKAATDKVLVFVPLQSKVTDSGIVLPDKLKLKLQTGTVVASGPNANNVLPKDKATFLVEGAVLVESSDAGHLYSMNVDYVMSIQREE